jgi:hypothetical protein
MERPGRAATGGRDGLHRREEFPARAARAVPGGMGGRRAGPDRRFRDGHRDARGRRPASPAAGLLRSGRMHCPALGSGGGQRAGREPERPARPVTRGSVADGPRPPSDAHAGAGSADTSAVARPGARGNPAPRARPGADAPAGTAAGADLDAPRPGLAVAFPVGTAAAVARRRRRLVSPLTLVGGTPLSPAALVVMTGIDATVAHRARRP